MIINYGLWWICICVQSFCNERLILEGSIWGDCGRRNVAWNRGVEHYRMIYNEMMTHGKNQGCYHCKIIFHIDSAVVCVLLRFRHASVLKPRATAPSAPIPSAVARAEKARKLCARVWHWLFVMWVRMLKWVEFGLDAWCCGHTGVGKDVFFRGEHRWSQRFNKYFPCWQNSRRSVYFQLGVLSTLWWLKAPPPRLQVPRYEHAQIEGRWWRMRARRSHSLHNYVH